MLEVPPAYPWVGVLNWCCVITLQQVNAVGEMLIEVGAPHGTWGPSRLSAQQMQHVLSVMKEAAARGEADLVVLREGIKDMATEGVSSSCWSTDSAGSSSLNFISNVICSNCLRSCAPRLSVLQGSGVNRVSSLCVCVQLVL